MLAKRLHCAGVATGLIAGVLTIVRPAAAPPSGDVDWAAILEAQGEYELASQNAAVADSVAADSLATSATRLQRTLRLLVQRRQYGAAWDTLQRQGHRLDAGERTVFAAALALRLDQPAAALAHLDAAGAAPALHGFAAALRAETLYRLERWDDARRTAEQASSAPLAPEMLRRLRLIEGSACLALGDMTRLRALAPRLGEDARLDDRTGLLLLGLARAAWAAGESAAAERWLLDLLGARPAPAESAFATLQTLQARGAWQPDPSASLALARYEDRSQRAPAARQRLESLVATGTLTPETEGEVWVMVAESLRRQGRTRDCLTLLDAHADRVRGTRAEPEMLRCRGRARRTLGDEAGIIATYRELARRFPADPYADDALYEVAWRQEIGDDFAAAARTYAEVQERFPQSPLDDDAAFRVALCDFRRGDFAAALDHFAAFETRHPNSPLVPRSLYWRAWILERRGDADAARQLRERLQRQHRDSYYAVLAAGADTLAAALPETSATSLRDTLDAHESPRADAALHLAARSHALYTGAIATLQRCLPAPGPAFAADARLWRFCLDYGLRSEALWETRRLEQRYAVDPGALLEMLAHSYARGVHERLVRLSFMLSLLAASPACTEAIEVVRYPAPLSVTLAAATLQHGVSHAVVLGVMRQESAFDPRADSRAGARGLLQIMPAVGRELAAKRGMATLAADRLYEPELNIDLGCQLFAIELRHADGSLPQALAAYNAGSEPAEKWRRRLRPEEPPELYLDVAEYLETRNYLERVLGGAATYRRVYALQ